MQYFSLQYQTLLPLTLTFTTSHYFCFGSAFSFFLYLFLDSFPVAYWASTDQESSSFSVISFCLLEMRILDHLTCLLRNPYAGQEAIVRTERGTTDWFQIGKGVHQGCILSPCLFNLYAEYIMRKAGTEGSTIWNKDCREKYK